MLRLDAESWGVENPFYGICRFVLPQRVYVLAVFVRNRVLRVNSYIGYRMFRQVINREEEIADCELE